MIFLLSNYSYISMDRSHKNNEIIIENLIYNNL